MTSADYIAQWSAAGGFDVESWLRNTIFAMLGCAGGIRVFGLLRLTVRK